MRVGRNPARGRRNLYHKMCVMHVCTCPRATRHVKDNYALLKFYIVKSCRSSVALAHALADAAPRAVHRVRIARCAVYIAPRESHIYAVINQRAKCSDSFNHLAGAALGY